MIELEVKDMGCGHCVNTITRAVQAVDPAAEVHVDLPAHRVRIEPGASNQAQLRHVIQQAGYTPVALGGEGMRQAGALPRSAC
jgi:copper chaperone